MECLPVPAELKNQEKKEVENPREVPEEIKAPSILLLSEQFHGIGK